MTRPASIVMNELKPFGGCVRVELAGVGSLSQLFVNKPSRSGLDLVAP